MYADLRRTDLMFPKYLSSPPSSCTKISIHTAAATAGRIQLRQQGVSLCGPPRNEELTLVGEEPILEPLKHSIHQIIQPSLHNCTQPQPSATTYSPRLTHADRRTDSQYCTLLNTGPFNDGGKILCIAMDSSRSDSRAAKKVSPVLPVASHVKSGRSR